MKRILCKNFTVHTCKNVDLLSSYLSVIMHPSFRCVLGQKIQSQTRQSLICVLVFPQQLQFTNGHQVGVGPDFHKEELAQAENFGAAILHILDGFVEHITGMMAARGPHKLQKFSIFSTNCRRFGHGWRWAKQNGLGLFVIVVVIIASRPRNLMPHCSRPTKHFDGFFLRHHDGKLTPYLAQHILMTELSLPLLLLDTTNLEKKVLV